MFRPLVTLKIATSLDGRIATAGGKSRWITGEAARTEVHRLRATHDAVLVGIETALADDPELTARLQPGLPRQPIRVVLDSRLRLPVDGKLARTTSLGEVIVFCAPSAAQDRRDALAASGFAIIDAPDGDGGRDVAAVLDLLGQLRGVRSVLVEGGGRIAGALLKARLVDRLEWHRAPMVMGGDGRAGIGDLGVVRLEDAPRFARTDMRLLGDDVVESYQREA